MILDEKFFGLILLIVDIQPAGRLGEEGSEDENEAAEETLQPGDEAPRVVATGVEATASCARGEDGTTEP